MDVSLDVQRLLSKPGEISPELLTLIQAFDESRYLHVLTETLLDTRYTDTILAACESTLSHCCAVIDRLDPGCRSLAVYGRIIPIVPHLVSFADAFLRKHAAHLDVQSRQAGLELEYLLALYRLLHHNHHVFASHISPSRIQTFLDHPDPAVRCIAARIISRYLGAADAAARAVYAKHVPDDDAFGEWERKRIHYKYLSLWERQRHRALRATLKSARQTAPDTFANAKYIINVRFLDPAAALLGGVLLPRSTGQMQIASIRPDNFVHTPTIDHNLRRFALALKSARPLLLTGLPGAGKTSIVRHAAHTLGKLDSMVTLHLNEQSDAKALVGLYTSGTRPGSFEWQPGPLTKAVTDGRWLLIEDLDRAPTDVLSTLLPLVEKRQISLPGQDRVINAATGFKLVATVRAAVTTQGHRLLPIASMLGVRHWKTVAVEPPSVHELPEIINHLHPGLEEHTPTLINVYQQLIHEQQLASSRSQGDTGIMRHSSLRDLLKLASRVDPIVSGRSAISPDDHDHIFLAAVDCFAGSLSRSATLDVLVDCIAQQLHVSPQRAKHLISHRDVRFAVDNHYLTIGTNKLRRELSKRPQSGSAHRAFSNNAFSLRLMDRIASAVSQKEPLLLVGETGTGKTTIVQHLADQLGKRLLPFNLSQQSESGDLLGGFKPVNIRSLMTQLKEEFDSIFYQSFSSKVILRNQPFLDALVRCMTRAEWLKVCKLWDKALDMVAESQKSTSDNPSESPNPSKKRKITRSSPALAARWAHFTTSFRNVESRLRAGGEASFAFAFVEGELIKAVRNGDWILLDEINLASSDTLESIAELLDRSPSITLSETGNIERVHAHEQFRVFAAMNPATDVGKKDLPLGIRSRFTEIYVESPDSDRASLQHIVKAYLGPTENALVSAVSALHLEIQQLASRDALVDGAGQRPHYSLRTLTRALSYATDIASQSSLRRALAEAFQMSYLTILDLESETRVHNAILKHFYPDSDRHTSEMSQALRPSRDIAAGDHVQVGKYWLQKGQFPIEDQPEYIITDFVRRNLDKLIRATSAKRSPVLLQGPTSAGKTSMVEYLAKRTGNKFVRINNHEHTDLQEYLGSYASTADGRMQFQDGVLIKALREGHWIVLDELNLAPTDVLEALNRLLDDNRELLIPETQEIVRPHKNFMLFATQNPAGLYGGRKFLSRAFRNRFLELFFNDIPIDELHIILQRRTQIPPSWSQRIVSVYKELSLLRQRDRVFEQKAFATLRDLFRWAVRPADTIQQLAVNGFLLLGERVRDRIERAEVKRVIEKVLSQKGPKVVIDESELYSHAALGLPDHLNTTAACNGIVWTNAMRRLYILTMHAIRNNEPVLLIGDTGCGKTSVCQLLATVLNQKLHIVNAHQNLETGDLIGAQRPLRNRAVIENQLISLLQSLNLAHVADAAESSGIDAGLAALDDCKDDIALSDETRAELHELRTRRTALFEWVDGSLVHAMKTGEMFLLDEIALADDSVLERLNSLLEPQRSILLAEKGSLESAITAEPGFQFFATMNPGGDYGKKELSPALRNRFTEIWVPPLTETADIVHVLQDKISVPVLAPSMVEFAQWFSHRYNKTASETISMRDLLTWVTFVNRHNIDSQGRAAHVGIVHGAALVYIDGLGANPAALLDIVPEKVEAERTQCVLALGQFFGIDALSVYNAPVDCYSGETAVVFGWDEGNAARFEIPKRKSDPLATNHGEFSMLAPTTKLNALRVARGLQLTKPILLEQPLVGCMKDEPTDRVPEVELPWTATGPEMTGTSL